MVEHPSCDDSDYPSLEDVFSPGWAEVRQRRQHFGRPRHGQGPFKAISKVGQAGFRANLHLAANQKATGQQPLMDKLTDDSFEGGRIVFAEVGNGFEVRFEFPQPPRHFRVVVAFGFQPTLEECSARQHRLNRILPCSN